MHAPIDSYWAGIKCIIRYLKGMTSYCFHITRTSSFALHGFMNTDWAISIDDQKSMGGNLVFFGQISTSWKSGKQRTIARSSIEAKYKALADDIAEIIWLHYLLIDLYIPSTSTPI